MLLCYVLAFGLSCLGAFPSGGMLHAQHQHSGLHHWEIPSKDPDRIVLTFSGDPANKRAVNWRTSTQIQTAVAQIAKATKNSKFEATATTYRATTEVFDLGAYKGNRSLQVHYHQVVFQNLEPGVLYAYRVGDGKKHWSEWIHFRTAQADYAKTQFVYFGDAQNDLLAHWSRVIRMAYQTAPKAAFAIHAGDLINRAHRDYEWAEWFKAGGFIHRQWTAIPVVGNHEFWSLSKGTPKKLSIQWRPQFSLPVEQDLPPELHETVYTVDYQEIRIIVLNSNEHLKAQTQYLEHQLKSSTARWNIVCCHHSIFSPAEGRDFEFARNHWKPLLDRYGVDLVLNGHDHTYARGHVPLRTTDRKRKKDLGTVYVTSVSGPKQYSLDPQQLDSYKTQGYRLDTSAEQTQFFQVITIENNQLNYTAYTAIGEIHDQMTIQKNFKTGEKKMVLTK